MSKEKKNDGGPVYPVPYEENLNGQVVTYGSSGISLRDHFAVNAPAEEVNTIMVHKGWANLIGEELVDRIAQARYVHADAMFKARKQ